nr:hypothetical protein QKQZYOMX_QKQZYOMX_CDS_0007 [Microvirus sp.]
MKECKIITQYYLISVKADKWLIIRLMTLFPWLDIRGSWSGLDDERYVSISFPAHVSSLVLPQIPKSCIGLKRKYSTTIYVYEEKII